MELSAQIIREIAVALEIDPTKLTIDTISSDIENWDSLGHLSILVRLDAAFDNVSERAQNLASVTSIREIVNIVAAHI